MKTLPRAFFRKGAFVGVTAIKYGIRLDYFTLAFEKTSIAKCYFLSVQ